MYGEDEHWSEHEEEDRPDKHHHFRSYYSTSLVVDRNITLADVDVEPMTESRLRDMRHWLEAQSREKRCTYGVIDPRAELKALRTHGDVDTLVPYDDVADIARRAEELIRAESMPSREE